MPDMVPQTLKEIALDKAKKRPELVDYLTEESPILAMLKFIPATHGLWNVEEVLSRVEGPSFVDLGEPLPGMMAETNLRQTYVSVLGGEMEVAKDKADQFGGAAKYFARRESAILKKAGMDTELAIWRDHWRKAALKAGLVTKGGATSKCYTVMVVRFDKEINIGIYDPNGFNQGRLVDITPINGGNLYHLRSQKDVLGYGVEYRGRFGWQNLAPERAVHAIVNVTAAKLPSLVQLEDAIAAVRGTAENTYIFGNHKILQKTMSAIKKEYLQMTVNDGSMKTAIGDINGVRVVGSYNLPDGTEDAVA
ncbi:major capsid protein [uncultured Desulfovibrio sp.]|uniref:major capsid protein n=1 Tax=uncultured Desulfovibrio sp. TaxID=167968 RepID=UPI00280629FF|nr:hypothetical protein [uncultured Desulfovibrio sp.]